MQQLNWDNLRYVLTPEAERMIDAAREVETTRFNMQRRSRARITFRG